MGLQHSHQKDGVQAGSRLQAQAQGSWPKDVGFFYSTCGVQVKALHETLRTTRQYYPDSFIYLLSDCDKDLQAIADQYKVQKYVRRSRIGNANGKMIMGNSLWFSGGNKDALNTWLKFFKDAADSGGCQWYCLLEDDVWIRGHHKQLPTDPQLGIAGMNETGITNWSQPLLKYLEANTPSSVPRPFQGYYSACGACIFRGNVISKVSDYLDAMSPAKVTEICNLDNRAFTAIDCTVSILSLMLGYKIGTWNEICQNGIVSFSNMCAFEHGRKDFYEVQDIRSSLPGSNFTCVLSSRPENPGKVILLNGPSGVDVSSYSTAFATALNAPSVLSLSSDASPLVAANLTRSLVDRSYLGQNSVVSMSDARQLYQDGLVAELNKQNVPVYTVLMHSPLKSIATLEGGNLQALVEYGLLFKGAPVAEKSKLGVVSLNDVCNAVLSASNLATRSEGDSVVVSRILKEFLLPTLSLQRNDKVAVVPRYPVSMSVDVTKVSPARAVAVFENTADLLTAKPHAGIRAVPHLAPMCDYCDGKAPVASAYPCGACLKEMAAHLQ